MVTFPSFTEWSNLDNKDILEGLGKKICQLNLLGGEWELQVNHPLPVSPVSRLPDAALLFWLHEDSDGIQFGGRCMPSFDLTRHEIFGNNMGIGSHSSVAGSLR
jgi:hypothetical protein